MDIVQSVKNALDITTVAERLYGGVEREGREWRIKGQGGLMVNAEKQSWYSFSEQLGGDVLDLLGYHRHGAAWRGRSASMFTEILQEACQLAGVPWRQEDAEKMAHAARLDDIRLFAALFYAGQYAGSPAQRYAEARGWEGVAEQAQLGYAPDAWNALCDALNQTEYSRQDCIDAGVISVGSNGKVYDTLRHRLIIPMIQGGKCKYLQGRELGRDGVAGIATAVTDDRPAKFKNIQSGSVPLYSLGRSDAPILTESTSDVLTFAAFGHVAVGATGAAIKDNQLHSLLRFQRVYVAVQNDAAGEAFGHKVAAILHERALIMQTPAGYKDWDQALRDGVACDTSTAVPWVRWMLNRMPAGLDNQGQYTWLEPVFMYLQILEDSVTASMYANEIIQACRWPAATRKEYLRKLAEGRKALHTAEESELPDPSLAEEEQDTWPYICRSGHMYFRKQRNDAYGGVNIIEMPIADFSAKIETEYQDEAGGKTFSIVGETAAGRSFTFDMPASDFADDRTLKAELITHAGAQAPIAVGMAKHLGTGIQRLSVNVDHVKRFNRTGWADGTFLIPGRNLPGTLVRLNRKLPYAFDETADLEKGLQALACLIRSHSAQVGAPALAFLLTPPLAERAGWRNERYGMFLSGQTGSLKSSWSQCAMCLWGPEFIRDDILVKWGQGATANAIMGFAVYAHDVPFLIDNYKPNTGDGAKGFVNLIHNIVEGGEKDRLNRSSELRESRPIFAWPLITGEDVPDHDPASIARVLVMRFVRTAESPALLEQAQAESRHLCAVGKAWIDWIESPAGKAAIDRHAGHFRTLRNDWAEQLQTARPDMVNTLRVASNLATNQLAWNIMLEHPAIGPVIAAFTPDYEAGIDAMMVSMADTTAEGLEATRFMGYVRQLLAIGELTLLQEGKEASGFDRHQLVGMHLRDGSYYVLPQIARARIERFFGQNALSGMSDRTLYEQMQRIGYIHMSAQGKPTKTCRIGGTVTRALHVRAGVLEQEEESSAVLSLAELQAA